MLKHVLKKTVLRAFAVALAMGLLALSAQAATSIGFDFSATYAASPVDLMTAAEVAGAPGFEQANWNSVSRAGSGTASNLMDSSGAATSVSITWTSSSATATTITDTPGDKRMMKGYLDTTGSGTATTTSTVTVSNIAYSSYAVVVYIDGRNAGNARIGQYIIKDSIGAATLAGPIFNLDASGADFAGTYIQSTSTTQAGATTGGNYIVFAGLTASSFRLEATGVTDTNPRAPINGIQIVSLYSKAVSNPAPANGAVNVSLTPTLSWDAPNDPNVVSVQEYKVYLDPNQANVANGTSMVVNSQPGTDLDYAPATLQYNTTYYWRVETTETVNDGNSPAIIPGSIWNFKTIPATPVIDTQPVGAAVNPDAAAQMSVTITSATTVTYQWYKSVDNSNATIIDDVMVGTNSNVLDIASASKTDEGYYYCTATNDGGSISSAVAKLGVFRQVAYWTLDSANYADNQYKDTSGEGHHADPNAAPAFVGGQIGDGVEILDSGDGWARAGTWNPSEFTGKFTVSFWLKWAGVNGTYQSFVAKRSSGTFSAENVYWQVATVSNGTNIQLQSPNGTTSAAGVLTGMEGQWVFVAATFDGTTSKIYFNGLQQASGTGFKLGNKTDALVTLGCNSGDREYMNGVLDDVRIYNYVLDAYGIAGLYHSSSGKSVCLSETKPALDYNNNCRVDLGDFAMFAKEWMDCGLVPTCVTQ